MDNVRKIKIQVYRNDQWKDIDFKELNAGDIFKAFADDGSPIHNNNGDTIFIAASNPLNTEENFGTLYSHNMCGFGNEDAYFIFTKPYPVIISNYTADGAETEHKDNGSSNDNDDDSEDDGSNEDDDEHPEYTRAAKRYEELEEHPIVGKYIKTRDDFGLDPADLIDMMVGGGYDIDDNEDWITAIKYDVLDIMLGTILYKIYDGSEKASTTDEEAAYIKDLKKHVEDYVKYDDLELQKVVDLSGIFDAKYDDLDEAAEHLLDAIHKIAAEGNLHIPVDEDNEDDDDSDDNDDDDEDSDDEDEEDNNEHTIRFDDEDSDDDKSDKDNDNNDNKDNSNFNALRFLKAMAKMAGLKKNPTFKPYLKMLKLLDLDTKLVVGTMVVSKYNIDDNKDWIKSVKFCVVEDVLATIIKDAEKGYKHTLTDNDIEYVKDLEKNLEHYIDDNAALDKIVDTSNIFNIDYSKYEGMQEEDILKDLSDMLSVAVIKIIREPNEN